MEMSRKLLAIGSACSCGIDSAGRERMTAKPKSIRERLRRISLMLWGLLFVFLGGLAAVVLLVYAKNPADGVGVTVAAVLVIGGAVLILLDFVQNMRT